MNPFMHFGLQISFFLSLPSNGWVAASLRFSTFASGVHLLSFRIPTIWHQQALLANFSPKQFYYILKNIAVDSALVCWLMASEPSLAVAYVLDMIFYDFYGCVLQLIFRLSVVGVVVYSSTFVIHIFWTMYQKKKKNNNGTK